MKQLLCRVDDLLSGEKKTFKIKNREIVLVRNGNDFYAVSGICPHQAASMGEGALKGTTLESDVGVYCFGKENLVLTCPWHHYEFDVTTGKSLFDCNYKLKSYSVEVAEENVLIDI
ncbi:Rieske (2Fe-2S) protein [Bacillus sp. FJAT-29814]|uniref:Rieske (2Fe-2S) protein n=1 Tax=Bacillus sp. FJAT-29814 TaxID=1729688 RepID=UPI00082EA760|nr:Rieske (2Fe-2S) protein [Bacillus sp. FJAT-29814]